MPITYTYIDILMSLCMHACMHACMYACLSVHMCSDQVPSSERPIHHRSQDPLLGMW